MIDTGAIEVLSTCCQAQVQIADYLNVHTNEYEQHYECDQCCGVCHVKIVKPLDYSLFD